MDMKVSENILKDVEGYIKLRSRQSSLKKNQGSKQKTQRSQDFQIYPATPIIERVEVSDFKLPISIPLNYLNYKDPRFQFGKPCFQTQLNQLQMGIRGSIMDLFKKEFILLCKSFRNTSNANMLQSSSFDPQYIKQTDEASLKIQQKQSLIKKNSSNFVVNTTSNNLLISSAYQNQNFPKSQEIINHSKNPVNQWDDSANEFRTQMAFHSFRKIQNLSKFQIKLQKKAQKPTQNNNFNQKNLQFKKNSQKTMKMNLFQTDNNLKQNSEHFKTDESQVQLGEVIKTINSPSLSLSPDQKKFRRSSHFSKRNHSEIQSDSNELSLISREKKSLKKKQSPLNSLYDNLANGKKVLVTNKLIFLSESVGTRNQSLV